MSIETKHNGHKIGYAENQDIWRCYSLDLEAKTLSALKTKINTELKRERAIEAMPALMFDGSYSTKAIEVVVTLIADEKRVWVMGKKVRYGSDTGRQKTTLGDLFADTPENRAALAEMAELSAQQEVLRKRMEAVKLAIPRLTMDDLKRVERESGK